MGTGAFKFVEYVKGSHWAGKRFDGYFRKDRPYLDGYKAFFVKANAVVPGMLGGQFDAEFRGRTPQERDQLVDAMKDKVTVLEGPWVTNMLLIFNTKQQAVRRHPRAPGADPGHRPLGRLGAAVQDLAASRASAASSGPAPSGRCPRPSS